MLDGVAVCGSTSNVCLPDLASVYKSADPHQVLGEVALSVSIPYTCRLSSSVSVPWIADLQQVSNVSTVGNLHVTPRQSLSTVSDQKTVIPSVKSLNSTS